MDFPEIKGKVFVRDPCVFQIQINREYFKRRINIHSPFWAKKRTSKNEI